LEKIIRLIEYYKLNLAIREFALLTASGLAVLFMTWYAIGIEADGYKYIHYGKKAFEEGFQFFLYNDLKQFPVFYSLFIGGVYQLVGDAYLAAKLLNIVGLYMLVHYTYQLLKVLDLNKSVILGTIIGLITSYPILKTISIVHTEPLFLGFLALIVFNIKKFDKQKTLYNLWIASFFLGFLALIRYAGVFFICSFILYMAINIYNKRLVLTKGLKITLIPFLLPLTYYLKNTLLIYEGNSFSFNIYETGFSRLSWLFETILNWFSPWEYISISVFLILIYIFLTRNFLNQWVYSTISIVTYIAGLFMVITFFNNKVPFNDRILLPIYFLTFVISVWTVATYFGTKYSYILLLFYLSYSLSNYSNLIDIHKNSTLWSHRSISESKIFENEKLQKSDVVLSNFPYLIKIRTGLNAKNSFYKKDFKNQSIEIDYSQDIALVYFHVLNYRDYFMEPDEIVSKHQLSQIYRDKAAVIITNF